MTTRISPDRESANAIEFNDYKRLQLLKLFVPNFFKIRLLILPLLIVLMLFFILYREPFWKTATLCCFIIIAFTYFTIEMVRLKRQPLADRAIGINLISVALLQNGVFFLTGGVESPVFPISVLFIMISNIIFDRGIWGLLVSGVYICGLIAMGLGTFFHWIPNAAPSFFLLGQGGIHARPVFFWIFFLCYCAVFINTTLLSRTLSQLISDYFTDLFHTREEVIRGFADRMRQIETIGSKMAHEIKNPLAAIKGLVQVIERGQGCQNEKDQKRLSVMMDEISRIEVIVDEFSTLSRPLEIITARPLDINKLLDDIAALYEMKLAQAGIRLLRQNPSVPLPLIVADERKLKQVLVNIIENALDAMNQGGTLSFAAQCNQSNQHLEIYISDTGSGIAAEHRDRIFDPFFTTKPHGTGLGLSIARAIMRQHGGDVSIQSGTGVGVTVQLTLPLIEKPIAQTDAGAV
ncbi:MAG: GHKL domain-containing protein [Chitinivibrionales bacterium]|nr:GHKL domain-containing protein [Chitinivibrionales bacterium]